MSRCLLLLGLIWLTGCGNFESNSVRLRAQEMVQSLSNYEREALSAFFRVLLEEECCGYALYGDKPLCVQEFFLDEVPLALNDRLLKRGVLLREGVRIWEKSGLGELNSNYIIRASRSPAYDGWLDLFFINRQSFLNTVDRHLPLFQYVLGPKVTPEALLDEFLDSTKNLASIFREDRVLNGLVLGYGMQNALYASRQEYLSDIRAVSKIQDPSPSFGFSNIQEELNFFKNELFVTSCRMNEAPRLPWFSAITHHETDALVDQYKKTQKKLRKVLVSPHFLEEVLMQLLGFRLHLPVSSLTFEELLFEKLAEDKTASLFLGQELRLSLSKENATENEVEYFIQGMRDVSGTREDLGPLLRKYDLNCGSEGKERLIYRLGQKVGDLYGRLMPILSVEEIIQSIQNKEKKRIDSSKRREIVDEATLLAFLKQEEHSD